MPIRQKITAMYDTFTNSERKIADNVLNNPDCVYVLKLAALSYRLSVGEATIIRFINKCGYKSYKAFQHDLLNESSAQAKNGDVSLSSEFMDGIIENLETMRSLADVKKLKKVAKLIEHADNVYLVGLSLSGSTAGLCAQILMRNGLKACSFTEITDIVNICNICDKSDVIIAYSWSGKTVELIYALKAAKKRGAQIVSILGKATDSFVFSDYILKCVSPAIANTAASSIDAVIGQIITTALICQEYVGLDFANRQKINANLTKSLMEMHK